MSSVSNEQQPRPADPKPADAKPRDKDGLHRRRGIWHYRLKVNGKWREFTTGTSKYKLAVKERQRAIQAQDEGRLPTDMAKWPFDKAAENWLAGRAHTVARNTHRLECNLVKSLRAVFDKRRLGDLTADDIRGYQVQRLAAVSSRTVNLEVKILRGIMRTAKLWARIADDYRRVPENGQGPGRALSPEDEKHLFTVAARKPEWEAAFYAATLAANTTARGGEIKGLRLEDVDLIERTLTIRRSTTKTDAGARVVPLNERATWALARLLERASRIGSVEPGHYLLPAARFRHTKEPSVARSGFDPASPMQTWRSAWRALTRAIDCPACHTLQAPTEKCRRKDCGADLSKVKSPLAGLRFHDLRHHAITRLAEAGVADQTLMSIAGHVSREMLEHYSHIRMQARREAVAALDAPKIAVGAAEPAAHVH